MNTIERSWTEVNEDIDKICEQHGLNTPVIIAVSKTRSFNEIEDAIDVGITDFGENNPKEFKTKSERFPDVNWHYIGPLQRNNVKDVFSTASAIHSLDRVKLANRLMHFEYSGDCFVQVNISRETTKSGVNYDKDSVTDLVEYSRKLGLSVIGLMTIGNPGWSKQENMKQYQEFVSLGKSLGLAKFSLGMSGDWQEALISGATHLRIGTAIFGKRT